MKAVFTEIEAFFIIIGSFAGLLLITSGLNLVIPYEEINPYAMVALGAVTIMITGAYAMKKNKGK